jgi:HipA-like protein
MTSELVTLLGDKEIGRVRNDARGRLTFVYDDDWRKSEDAYPLSLSMPLAAKEHGPSVVQAFLWGLLPDNEPILDRWAAKFQVSARNVFALISHVGEDCAGAVQFVVPERRDAYAGVGKTKSSGSTKPISPTACKFCAPIMPHGGCRATPASSAWPARNRTPHCFSRMSGGEFPPGVSPPRIF